MKNNKSIKNNFKSSLLIYTTVPFFILIFAICMLLSNNEWSNIYLESKIFCKTHADYINARLDFILKNSDSIITDGFVKKQFSAQYDTRTNKAIEALYNIKNYFNLFHDPFSSSLADIVIYHNNYTLYQSQNSKYIESLDNNIASQVLKKSKNETFWVNSDNGKSTAFRNCSDGTNIIILTYTTFLDIDNLSASSLSSDSYKINLVSGNVHAIIPDNSYTISYTISNSQSLVLTIDPWVRHKIYIKYISVSLLLSLLFLLLIQYAASQTSTNLTRSLYNFINAIKSDMLYQDIDTLNIEKTDELFPAYQKMKQLITDINNSYKEAEALRNENNRLQLLHMQTQINPHLLYNSLSVLKWDCMKYASSIADKIDVLVDYYRLSIMRFSDNYTFENELELVKKYLQIISIIHNFEYKYAIEFDDDLKKQKTIQHIFQPIIENSILHGINNNPNGLIKLCGHMTKSDIYIEISDNGFGINEEILNELNSYESNTGNGYGIKNTFRRIKLFYGDNCKITVKSVIGKGTKIIIHIPITH